jgi:hypothetical protein
VWLELLAEIGNVGHHITSVACAADEDKSAVGPVELGDEGVTFSKF